ncbi:MAG: hypothetical protein HPY71_06320 [Firmicutes bacterium]|nr:hypothetical protein [Bacillota bacterium]
MSIKKAAWACARKLCRAMPVGFRMPAGFGGLRVSAGKAEMAGRVSERSPVPEPIEQA